MTLAGVLRGTWNMARSRWDNPGREVKLSATFVRLVGHTDWQLVLYFLAVEAGRFPFPFSPAESLLANVMDAAPINLWFTAGIGSRIKFPFGNFIPHNGRAGCRGGSSNHARAPPHGELVRIRGEAPRNLS